MKVFCAAFLYFQFTPKFVIFLEKENRQNVPKIWNVKLWTRSLAIPALYALAHK